MQWKKKKKYRKTAEVKKYFWNHKINMWNKNLIHENEKKKKKFHKKVFSSTK